MSTVAHKIIIPSKKRTSLPILEWLKFMPFHQKFDIIVIRSSSNLDQFEKFLKWNVWELVLNAAICLNKKHE